MPFNKLADILWPMQKVRGSQALASSAEPSNDVLRLIRLAALFMLITLVPIAIALLSITHIPGIWKGWAQIVLALLPIVFIFAPGLERRLGNYYLPIALFLFITALAIELTTQSSRHLRREFLIQTGLDPEMAFSAWRSEPFFFLLVPTVLAAWVYGRKGALRAATWASFLHIAGGLWLWHSETGFSEDYWKTIPLRLIVLYTVSLVVAYLATRQRQQHEALEAAHRQLQRQAALTEQLAASRERNRLARDLHDTLAHSLAALVVELEAVSTLFDLDPEATRIELNKAQALARAGLDGARVAIRDLRESPAQALGLGPALRQLVNDFGERTGLQAYAEFFVSGPDLSLSPETTDALYRIAQEALANVNRHACATLVALRMEMANNALILTVSDDGVGFEPATALDGHYGLLGMRERADIVGATLQIESQPGSGTRISVQLANKLISPAMTGVGMPIRSTSDA